MSDKRRHGSLGWYENSKRGLVSLIPRATKTEGIYGVKVGMCTKLIEEILTPITLVQLKQMKKLKDHTYEIDLTTTKGIKKKVIRTLDTSKEADALRQEVLSHVLLDVIALSKGKGNLGPVQRRHIKTQKRKAAGSGVTRKPGAMGLRIPGKVVWTKPMAGKTGFSRRTIFNLKNCGHEQVKNHTSLRYHVKEGTLLWIKGAVPGPIGRPLFLRKAQRS